MTPSYSPEELDKIITAALAEDIGSGDVSAAAALPDGKTGKAKLLIKEDGIIAGIDVARKIFQRIDPSLTLEVFKNDGDEIRTGEIAFIVSGKASAILAAERVVLNCMQRMSGIATYARKLCDMIRGTRGRLMDTRKTTPNFRLLEKWAVAIGGGLNHRMGLYDMIMIKDNHADLAGGIGNAISNVKRYLKESGKKLRVEVETRNLNEVKDVLQAGGVDVIMLDNMSIEDMRAAVALIGNKCKTEASGGITESNLKAVAETGVDYISMGALTHSVKSLDLSLKVQ